MMLLLTRAMISSTTVISLDWLGGVAGAGAVAAGGVDPAGSAAWACCPNNGGTPRRIVNSTIADFFINNLIGTGQLTRSLN
jgi:hypothetical protein